MGALFSAAQLKQRGSILLPAGTHGPAFIALKNFYVLKTYNESDLYALFVGHLADRYGKNRTFEGKWGKVGGLTRGDTLDMQKRLVKRGYDVGGRGRVDWLPLTGRRRRLRKGARLEADLLSGQGAGQTHSQKHAPLEDKRPICAGQN